MDRAAVDLFSRQLTVATRGMLEQDVPRLLQETARAERARVLAEQAQRAGVAPTDIVTPDGRRGAPLETAKRVVVIEYAYLREVAREVFAELIRRGPVKSGAWRRGIAMLVGGSEVDDLEAIRHETSEVAIVATVPYARRLEVGKRSNGRPFAVQVPPRLVEKIALAARRRFGNMAAVSFAYFDLEGAYALRRAGRRRGKDRRRGSPLRYPGIRIVAL